MFTCRGPLNQRDFDIMERGVGSVYNEEIVKFIKENKISLTEVGKTTNCQPFAEFLKLSTDEVEVEKRVMEYNKFKERLEKEKIAEQKAEYKDLEIKPLKKSSYMDRLKKRRGLF